MADLTPICSALDPVNGKPQPLLPGQLSIRLREELADRLAFNELTLMAELDSEPIPAHRLEHLYIDLSELRWCIDKRKAIDAVLKVARESSYHPVVLYLDHVAADDGIEPVDLNTVARDYLGTTDPLYNSMLAATLIGAVARAMEPGSKHDTCCVLRGPQGVGKSTAWRTFASPEWFCDTPQESEKDLKLAIHTCWFYELAELDALTGKKEAAQVKAMLSSPTDTIRPPYGSGMEKQPRRSIMVGTCNRDDFLRDETGSRRFWVIEVASPIDTDRIREDRDRIWKAAVLAYRDGQLPILSPEDQAESNRRNLGYAPEHPWLALLSRWMPKAPAEFTTDEALTGSGCVDAGRIERRHQMEAKPLLEALGFHRDAHQSRADGGQRPRLWRRLTQPVSTSAPEVETGQTPDHDSDSAGPSQPLNQKTKTCQEVGKGEESAGEVLTPEVERLRQTTYNHPRTQATTENQAPESVSTSTGKVETAHEADEVIARLLRLRLDHPNAMPYTLSLELEAAGHPGYSRARVEALLRQIEEADPIELPDPAPPKEAA